MIRKRDSCLYCGEEMESKTAKKKFCSDKCKVYWHRENKSPLDKPIKHIPPSKREIVEQVAGLTKNKHYDYSKMPKKLSMIQQLVWKENARAEQDKQ